MKISEEIISGWRGYRLSAGDVSVGLTPDIGGRIMSLAWRGEELLYAHGPEAGKVYDFSHIKDLPAFKKGFGFRIFGGDKTWVAPEKDWQDKIPPLELDAGPYTLAVEGETAVMMSPVCRETGLQIIRRISLDDGGVVSLQEEFLNRGLQEVVKGIWNVTQIRKPFDVYIPARIKAVRSYHDEDPTLPDPLTAPVEKEGWVKIPARGEVCYKFGAMPFRGQAVAVRETACGKVAFSRVFDMTPQAPYAHRSVVEVFNSPGYDYGELEVHSPLYSIAPQGRVRLVQKWQLSEAGEVFF